MPHNICNGCIIRIKKIHDEKLFFVANEGVLRNLLSEYREIEEQTIDFSEDEDTKMLITEDSDLLAKEEIVETLVEADENVYQEEYLVQSSPIPTTSKKKRAKKKRTKRKPEEDPLYIGEVPRINDHKCYVCFMKFDSELDLHEHLGLHVKLLPYTCQECILESVVLNTLTALNNHKKMHQKPVNCQYCDRSFISQRSAEKHAEIYHLDADRSQRIESEIFECDCCEKTYSLKSSLRRHMKNHQEKGRSSHQCTKCDKAYLSLHALKIHTEQQHMNEKAILYCDKCHQQFNNYRNLKSHLKAHESKPKYIPRPRQSPKIDETEYFKFEVDEEKGEITYVCTECEKITDDLKIMRTHIRTHMKIHQCSYCDKSFCRPSKKIDHERTHTGNENGHLHLGLLMKD